MVVPWFSRSQCIALLATLCIGTVSADPTLGTPAASSALDDSAEVISVTIPSGTNRALYCAVSYEDNTGSIGDSAVVIASGGGINMTAAAASATQGTNYVRFFYTLEASLPAAGAYNVTATTTSDQAASGALGLTCWPFSADAAQIAPEVYSDTGTNVDVVSGSVPFVVSGDYLLKATSVGRSLRPAAHGPDSWTERMDLQVAGTLDSSQSSADRLTTSQGAKTVTTTLTASANRVVQSTLRVQAASDQVAPESGVDILMKACPSSGTFTPPPYRGAQICGPNQNQDCCPPILTGGGIQPNLTDTTVDAEPVSTTRWGTMYSCLTTSATPKTAAEIIAGTGCADTSSVTVDANTGVGAFTGANTHTGASSTVYYVQVTHQNGNPDAMVQVLGPVTTPASGETGGGTSGGPVPAGSIYVRCGLATGANNGTTHADAYRTWAAAAAGSKVVSQDMYFFEGASDCSAGTTSLNAWDGTQNDPVVIGAYYMDVSTPTIGYESARPIIAGSYTPGSCDAADSCAVSYNGMIDIDNENDVVVRDIELRNWNGRAVDAEGQNENQGGTGNDRIRVENVRIHYVARQAILFKSTREYAIAYGNYVTNPGACYESKYTACPGRPGAVTAGFRQGFAEYGYDAVNLFENNVILSGRSESIGCYLAKNCLIRGNIQGAMWSSGPYMDHGNNFVIENNIIMGDPNDLFGAASRISTGIAGGHEAFLDTGGHGSLPATLPMKGISRNNLIVNVKGQCLEGSDEGTGTAAVDYQIYGNTCVYSRNFLDYSTWAGPITNLDVRGNIFYGGPGQACNLPAGTTASNNVWGNTPTDGDCKGAGDLYNTDPIFTSDAILDNAGPGNFDGTEGTGNLLTDFSAAELLPGSPAIGRGVASLTTTKCLDADSTAFQYIQGSAPDKTTWEMCLAYDAENNVRSTTAPDAGALEN